MKKIFKKVKGWASPNQISVDVFYPKSIKEIKQIIKSKNKNSLISRGNGRAYGDAAQLKNGSLIKLSHKYFKNINLDSEKNIVTVGAGLLICELLEEIVPKGFFLPVTPGTSKITLGGAVASDVHGKNHPSAGSFGNHVKEIKIIDGEGNLKVLTRFDIYSNKINDEFLATLGGMGLTGVIVEVSIYLKKISSSLMNVYSEKFCNLRDLIKKMNLQKDFYQYNVAWIDCFDNNYRSVLTSANHLEFNRNLLAEKNLFFKSNVTINYPFNLRLNLLNPFLIKLFNKFIFWRSKNKKLIIKNLEDYFYPLDKVRNWNKIYGEKGFTQYQFAVPENETKFIFFVLNYLRKYKLNSYLAVLKKFGNSNNAYLSFPIEGWTLALDFPNKDLKYLKKIFRELDEKLIQVGGRLYLSKSFLNSNNNILEQYYPNFDKWKTIKNIMDPRSVFCSDLFKEFLD